MNPDLKKPNFFSAFWESCFNLGFYSIASKASWGQIVFHSLVLSILITFAYSAATYLPLKNNLEQMFAGIPMIEIQEGKAKFDENLKLPDVRKFPKTGAKKLYYIIDSGENLAKLEETYPMYIIFTKTKIVFFDGKQRVETPYTKIEKDPSSKAIFGDPITFSETTLATFTAGIAIVLVALVFFGIVLIALPIFNLLAALLASFAGKWNMPFSDIFKLATFAATPSCIIQAFGCFFLKSSAYIGFLIALSWTIQIAYLIKGLKVATEPQEPSTKSN
ncbi:MAG: DUF1189 family protein [Candidatus Caenarcaniphilales bacterium]|nr:DUF1189 family protein [Candidatus Caenarcaniphilales bacterium]